MAPGALDPLTKELLYLVASMVAGCVCCTAGRTAFARAKGMTDAMYGELLASSAWPRRRAAWPAPCGCPSSRRSAAERVQGGGPQHRKLCAASGGRPSQSLAYGSKPSCRCRCHAEFPTFRPSRTYGSRWPAQSYRFSGRLGAFWPIADPGRGATSGALVPSVACHRRRQLSGRALRLDPVDTSQPAVLAKPRAA